MSLVIDGKLVKTNGLSSVSFLDDDRFALQIGHRPRRTGWVRGIVFHTRMGVMPKEIKSWGQDRKWDELVSRRWANSGRMAGAHIAIDGDGSYACLADLLTTATYHAGQVNEYTVGIEMYQDADGTMYLPTLETAVLLADSITRALGIQRQFASEQVICSRFASPVKGNSKQKSLAYRPDGREGRDFVGLYGHRNCTLNRGRGDPSDEIWQLLAGAGYESYEVDKNEDRIRWADRQAMLKFDEDDCDGIPGPQTVKRLLQIGKPHGLWIPRPGDTLRE